MEREGEPEKLGSRPRWLELHSESGGKPWGTRSDLPFGKVL